MSHVMRKSAFGASDRVTRKPARLSLEISDLDSIAIILSRQRTRKALIRLCGCAGWSASLLFAYGIKQVFSWRGSYVSRILVTFHNEVLIGLSKHEQFRVGDSNKISFLLLGTCIRDWSWMIKNEYECHACSWKCVCSCASVMYVYARADICFIKGKKYLPHGWRQRKMYLSHA